MASEQLFPHHEEKVIANGPERQHDFGLLRIASRRILQCDRGRNNKRNAQRRGISNKLQRVTRFELATC
jgi:hypothetical protein